MTELGDVHDSGSWGRKAVEVQVLLPAHFCEFRVPIYRDEDPALNFALVWGESPPGHNYLNYEKI